MLFEKLTCRKCRDDGKNPSEPPVEILVETSGFSPLVVENRQYVVNESAPLADAAVAEKIDVAGKVTIRCKHGHQWTSRLVDGQFEEVEPSKEDANVTPFLSKTNRPLVTGPKA